jgi:putative oxidoreductase
MNWFIRPGPGWAVSTAALLVRLAIGVAFILHGWPKLQNPTGWMDAMGMQNTPPGFLQAAAAVIEVAGGALLVLGLVTRIAALLLVAQMIGALVLVHIPRGDPFVSMVGPSAELAVAYLTISLLVVAVGPGAFSLDYMIFGRPVMSPLTAEPGRPTVAPAGM